MVVKSSQATKLAPWVCAGIDPGQALVSGLVLGALSITDLVLGLAWQGLVVGAFAGGAWACWWRLRSQDGRGRR